MRSSARHGRRVVLYTESRGRGGAEIVLRHLVGGLDPSFELVLMGVDPAITSWIASARPGMTTVEAPEVAGKFSAAAFVRLRRAIERLRPDIFQANLRELADARYAIAAALTIPSTRVVAVEHLPYPPATRLALWLKRRTSRRLAAHVAVGVGAARLIERQIAARPGSIRTIHNGVPDLGPLPEPPLRSVVVVGSLARIDRIKGLDLLIEAAAALPGVHVKLVGDGPELPALVELAERLDVRPRIEFLPWSDDPRSHLQEMDVFCLPSRNEGLPLSILEAMLAARPVVATDVGSVGEAVDPATGIVVPVDDVAALRTALEHLAVDRALRLRLGRAGRAKAVESFTVPRMARAFESLYNELVPR
jgi:glycosyltransferase involved in cell wall biosynthesis